MVLLVPSLALALVLISFLVPLFWNEISQDNNVVISGSEYEENELRKKNPTQNSDLSVLKRVPEPGLGPPSRPGVKKDDSTAEMHFLGQVLGPQGPVEGAVVYSLASANQSGEGKETFAVLPTLPPLHECIAESRSDSHGLFKLPVPGKWASMPMNIIAIKPGYLRGSVSGIRWQLGMPKIRIFLTRGMSISGKVQDPTGKPVPGLMVIATTDLRARSRSLRARKNYSNLINARPNRIDSFFFSEAKSTQDGSFSIHGLAPGEYILNVAGDAPWVMREHPAVLAGSENLLVIVSRACRFMIAARDHSSGKPVGRFQVFVTVEDGSGEKTSIMLTGKNNGIDFFHSDRKRTEGSIFYKFEIVADGYINALGTLQCDNRGETHRLSVFLEKKQAVSVRCTVLDPMGRKIKDYSVWVSSPKELSFHQVPVDHSPSGEAIIEMVPGDWLLKVHPKYSFPGSRFTPRLLRIKKSNNAKVSIKLRSEASLILDMQRLHMQRKVKEITFRSKRGLLRIPRPADAMDGIIQFVFVTPGEWEVVIQGPGMKTLRKNLTIMHGENYLKF